MSPIIKLSLLSILLAACGERGHGTDDSGKNNSISKQPATYVGAQQCSNCHQDQYALWQGSHHDLAMQHANEQTVLGAFNNTSFDYFGTTTSFFRKNGQFMVRTDGPDGALHDYEIRYTFGSAPLQQYLVEFPGGRLQALSIAWDTRPAEQGGQRWFHLYPDASIAAGDELHWSRSGHNWNTACAECHSTHLKKNYSPENDSFNTSWSEIDVACEACHGPGSEHVSWAERKPGWEQLAATKGLTLALDERKGVHWKINPKTAVPARNKDRGSDKEIEICAHCHSRRSALSADYVPGEPLLDHFLPRLLDAGLYYADGQIDDEVYVHGSFIQSRMYHAGVTCSDCHEPHSLKLRKPGNGVCLQCHAAERFDRAAHHFHAPGSAGARCAECHMPPKTYMVIDPRHDHSMRIPRPDLSVALGTPDACTNCHQDKSPAWAAGQVETWYGHTPGGFQHYARALDAARRQLPSAAAGLAALVRDTGTPAIVRATALDLMRTNPGPGTMDALTRGLADTSPRVRVAALTLLESAPLELRARLAFPLLSDPVRAVRNETARILAAVPAGGLTAERRVLLEHALQGYVASQQVNAEFPGAQMNLGNLYAARSEPEKAIAAYQTAVVLDPHYVPGYVNLADLYRTQGNEPEAENILRRAKLLIPGSAELHHALGLSLVRQQRTAEAVGELEQAAALYSDNPRYSYVYAIALNSTGKPEQALTVLEQAQNAHPYNTDILRALVALHRDLGSREAARTYADQLEKLLP